MMSIETIWGAFKLFFQRYDFFWPIYTLSIPFFFAGLKIGLWAGRSEWYKDWKKTWYIDHQTQQKIDEEVKRKISAIKEKMEQKEEEYKQQIKSMYEETRKQLMIEFQERINKIQNREEELRGYHESLQRRARALDDSEQELKEREAKINKYLLKMKDLEKKISSLQNKRDLRKQELTGLYCMFRNHLERYGVLTEEAANQAFKYLRKAKRKRLF